MRRRDVIKAPFVASAAVLASKIPAPEEANAVEVLGEVGVYTGEHLYVSREVITPISFHPTLGLWYEWRQPSLGPYRKSVIINPKYWYYQQTIWLSERERHEGETPVWDDLVQRAVREQVMAIEHRETVERFVSFSEV